MNNKKIILWSFIDALGVFIYVFAVALLSFNAEKIFGKVDTLFGPITFLLLFVLSAAITGSLVLGRPIFLYLENFKQESVKLLLLTIFWIFLFTIFSLSVSLFK